MLLDNEKLKQVIAPYLTGEITVDDVVGDGIFELHWRSTDTFYRHTEDYVLPARRVAYKLDLERAFPNMKAVL
jgi:hypothetical protein